MNNEINGKTFLSVTASIAAAIIPDTPIVSIAGSTLSEITTTTTSTTTTPTPTPMPTSFISSTKQANKDNLANSSNNPMSDAAHKKSAGGNGITTANAAATNTHNAPAADAGCIAVKTSMLEENTTIVNAGKTDDVTTNTTIDTKKSDVSDLEEPDLKKLLEEAYAYKTPKDKKDKSEIFLDLLQKVENEDRGITSTRSESHRHHPHSQGRHQQKQGGSLQDLLQLPSDYRRQNHTSRHKKNSSVSSRQREGGSLPSNVNVANCLLNSFEQQASVYADKRVRRAFLLGVESATAVLNSNNTLVAGGTACSGNNAISGQGSITTSGSGSANSSIFCGKDSCQSDTTNLTNISGSAGVSIGNNMATTATGHNVVGSTMATSGAGIVNTVLNSANSIKNTGDYIINIGDMIDIQQQQQILPSKAQDGGQGLPFYERVDIDMRIPRASLHGGEVDFAPTRSHHYVDEVIRFHQIDSSDSSGSLCESGEVAISVNALGNTLKSAAASCSLPMPLDERYRSIKSVMGEKGDSVVGGTNVNPALAVKTSGNIAPSSGHSSSIVNNITSGVSSGSSIGIGNYTKSLPLTRQTDENGNDCERQQHSSSNIISSAGQSQAKTKAKKKPQKDNTIPVDVENEAGYRGKDPVEVLVKFIESTEEDGKQGGGGGGNSNKFSENSKKKERKKEKVKQNKMKKSNSLEELRSCAKIDVGELKQSAATTENNNVTMRTKGSGSGSKGSGSKNTSVSTADINKNFDGNNKEVATTVGNNAGKQANVASTTTSSSSSTTMATMNNRKGERRSWGTEELQYLGTEGSVGGVGSATIVNNIEEKVKEKKEKKNKDKEKDRERERDIEKEKVKDKDKEKEKDKEKDTEKFDKLSSNKADSLNLKVERHDKNEKIEKTEKQIEKLEKADKTEKPEKRKKSENIIQTSITPVKSTTIITTNQEHQGNSTPVISAIDLLSMNTLISETAEFHVVTKKKKPKKQRASIDDTHFAPGSNYNNNYNYNNSGTNERFTRTHNSVLNTQKGGSNGNSGSSYGNQQQQTRYKHYNNNAHVFNNYGNSGNNNNNNNNNSNSSGDGGRLDHHNNYNSNYNNNNYINHSHQQYGHQQQSQYHSHNQSQQHHHQHNQNQHQHMNAHHNTSATSSTDKSRRKSTSSVPPSEKSDSSDIDSVHSLPIESTTPTTNKSKQRHKPASSSATTTPETPKNSSASSGSPASAVPISYAHIAAAAAVERFPILDVINNNNGSSTMANDGSTIASNVTNNVVESPQQQVTHTESSNTAVANIPNASATATTVSSSTNSTTKANKSKKQISKPDFPELVATNATNPTIVDAGKTSIVLPSTATASTVSTTSIKTISYSQSLVAAPTQLNSAVNTVSSIAASTSVDKIAAVPLEAVSITAASPAPVCNLNVPDGNKVDPISSMTTRLAQIQHQPTVHHHQQQQQQPSPPPQQTLQKSKSVENDSYSFNSSNLDQQYPALEKTVKRHSTTNVSISASAATPINTAGATGVGNSGGATIGAVSTTVPTNIAASTKYNFAAAAKQLPNKIHIGSQPTTAIAAVAATYASVQDAPEVATASQQLPSGAAQTTSSTNYPMATTVTPPTAIPNPLNPAAAITAPTVVTARKIKEKSPTSVFVAAQTANQTATATVQSSSSVMTKIQDTGATNTARKTKKEKAHQLPMAAEASLTGEQYGNVAQKSSTATQTQTSSVLDTTIVAGNKPTQRSQATFNAAGSNELVVTTEQALGKVQRQQFSSSKSNVTSSASTCTNNATTAAAAGVANRPAVIILNDDRSGDASIEFTFGDFNEDELKFFDDTVVENECVDEYPVTYEDITAQQRSQRNPQAVEVKVVKSNEANAISTSSYASDPSENVHRQSTKVQEDDNKMKTHSGAESNTSKRAADRINVELTEDYHETLNDVTVAIKTSDIEQRRNSETAQLQQLETCNEIETAIIAAARAAAEHQQPQTMQPPPPPSQQQQQPQQQQQQQQRSYRHKHQHQLQHQYRSTSYGNNYDPPTQHREHRSQTSYPRDMPNHYQSQQQHQHQHQHHYHNQYHQHHQQQQQHYHYHQSGSSNSASRSRSSSSNNNTNSFDAPGSTPPAQSPNLSPGVVVNVQRKEFDIHFIPPTLSNAHSSLQHNEIIVDFIGSAWEEVSKVTKFYEGQ